MSVEVMAWVFKESRTRWGERLVALAMADNADAHGRCWPSVGLIAERAKVSRATVKRATSHMVELGELEITDRGRQSNLYRFTCGLKLSRQEDLVGSSRNLVGSSATVCGLTGEPQNHQEPSRTVSVGSEGSDQYWADTGKWIAFDSFWAAYPKKRHRPAARKAWLRLRLPSLVPLHAGLARWKASDAWQRGFIEDASTFLNQRQWEDIPPPAKGKRTEPPGGALPPKTNYTQLRLEAERAARGTPCG